MKSIKYIVLPLCALLAVSCAKWLEEDPKANADLGKLSETEQTLEILAVGAYSSLQPLYSPSNNPGVVGTDETMTIALNQIAVRPLDQYIFSPSNSIFANAWNRSYAAIQQANIVIDRVQREDISEQTRLRLTAEMRFIRAFVYFRLVQWFGELPLITNETPGFDKTVTKISRSPIRNVYDLIVSDLEFASAEYALAPTAVDGRVTRSAARALLAKVYLTMGTAMQRSLTTNIIPGYRDLPLDPHDYYRRSYDLTKGLIESNLFSLSPSYGDLFLPALKFKNRESIWEIQYSAQDKLGSQWSKYFGMNGSGGQVHTYNAMVGRHIYQPVPGLIGYYKRGDRRYAWNIKDWQVNIAGNVATGAVTQGPKHMSGATSWKPADLNPFLNSNALLLANISCTKYRWGSHGDPEEFYLQNDMNKNYAYDNCPNNVIVLRYADVILMYAEADLLMNGGTASKDAVTKVNLLVTRAREGKDKDQMLDYPTDNQGNYISGTVSTDDLPYYLHDYTIATLTYDELKKERARELCFEFHRWNDLVRWGDLVSAVNNRLHAVADDVTKTAIAKADEEKFYLFPIPQTEIDVSGLAQNPYYTASAGEIENE